MEKIGPTWKSMETSWVWDSFFFALWPHNIYKCKTQLHCCYYHNSTKFTLWSKILVSWLLQEMMLRWSSRQSLSQEMCDWKPEPAPQSAPQGRQFKQTLCMKTNNSFRKLKVDCVSWFISSSPQLSQILLPSRSSSSAIFQSARIFDFIVKELVQDLFLLKPFLCVCVLNSLPAFIFWA